MMVREPVAFQRPSVRCGLGEELPGIGLLPFLLRPLHLHTQHYGRQHRGWSQAAPPRVVKANSQLQ